MHAMTLDDRRWQAVIARDATARNFVYAVSTTGIYCRPGCASRRPNRANVQFFASPAAAARAGYRSCRRCKPDWDNTNDDIPKVVLRACRLLESDEIPSLATLAGVLEIGPHQLRRAFRASLGLTPKQYAAATRRSRLRDGLKGGRSVTTALMDAGYNSLSRAYSETGKALGMSPKRYRAGGVGERIGYAVVPSTLGPLLVAATKKGVCAVEFGASEKALTMALRQRLPSAIIERTDSIAAWVNAVVAAVDDGKPARGVPLDVRGTAFQHKVWAALKKLPPGKTVTYTEVARHIGRPAAIRAVAGACAANTLGILIPCHRVVRSDGGVGGYRWGLKRKKALLQRESGGKQTARKAT